MYGPLNIYDRTNYIRVHSNKAMLNPEGTEKLDLSMSLTNLETGETELLEDEIIQFGTLNTHNFQITMPIDFDTSYRVELEDGQGFTSALTSITTKESELSILRDTVRCNTPFRIELTNFLNDTGEQIDVEVGVRIGPSWHYTHREMSRTVDSDNNTIVFAWTPNRISEFILGRFDAIDCSEFTSDKIRVKFTHIGYMKDKVQQGIDFVDSLENFDPAPNKQIVLSKYSLNTEIQIDQRVFDQP